MNKKDRNITIFLFIFLIVVGLYMSIGSVIALTGTDSELLFEFANQDMPIFTYIAQLGVGLVAVFAGIAMWLRLTWAPTLALFSSGLLIAHTLNNMGKAIYDNPIQAIIMVVILIIMFQSFPFLMRSSSR